MFTEILQQIGLSLNEAKIYETLLDLKEGGVSEIATQSNIHRRNAYDAMKRLIEKGLVFPILSKGENRYSPVDPSKLLELVREKESRFTDILPELQKRYRERPERQEAYIYRGIEGFKNYMRDILRVGQDVYFIGGKMAFLSSQIKPFSDQFFKEAKKKKIKFYGIYDYEVKKLGKEIKCFDPPYKFLPPSYSSISIVIIFGDYVVTYADVRVKKIDEHVTIFVLRDQNLAEGYQKWFQFMSNRL